MSRDYGRVRTLFWGDEKVRELAPLERYLGLYVMLSPHSNAIGCFRLPVAYICEDTGMTASEVGATFEALECRGIARRLKGGFVWIPNYLRHNPPENPNVWRKCVKELQALPGDLACRANIASEIVKSSADKRMNTLTDDEKSKLTVFLDSAGSLSETVSERLGNGIETVSERLFEEETTVSKGSIPNLSYPILTEPSLTPPPAAAATGGALSKSKRVSGQEPDAEFDQFWDACARKEGKPSARKAWKAATKKAAPEVIIAGMVAYAKSRVGEDQKFTKTPGPWLNDERWATVTAIGPQRADLGRAPQHDDRDLLRARCVEIFKAEAETIMARLLAANSGNAAKTLELVANAFHDARLQSPTADKRLLDWLAKRPSSEAA